MKKFTQVNKSSVMVTKWSRNGREMVSIKPLLIMLALLMVALFGVNENAWGTVTTSGTITSTATLGGKSQYVVWTYTGDEKHTSYRALEVISRTDPVNRSSNTAPAGDLYIELKRDGGWVLASQTARVDVSVNNSSWTDVSGDISVGTSYSTYGGYSIARDAKYVRLISTGGAKDKYHKKVYMTLASFCETATTELSYGSKTYLTEDTLNFTINWSNKADAQLSISGTDASHYEIIEAKAAGNKYIGCSAGKYGYTTVKVRYKRDAVGTHNSATLSGGGISIALKGSTTAGTPSINCSQVSASTLTYGQKLSASTISGPNASYKGGSYAGTYSWKRSDASTHVAQGCTNYVVKFTPTNANLNSVECTSVQVPITMVSQTITWNQETTYFIDQNATLSASTTGNTNVYFTSGNESIATISGNTVVMKKAGDVVITAHADATCNYNAASTVSYTLQFRNRPTISWTLTGENDHIYSGDTLVNLALTSFGTTNLNLPLTYSADPANLVYIPEATKDSVIVKECTENKTCTITVSFAGNGTYCAAEATHTYTFEPKITPVMKTSGNVLRAEGDTVHMLIGDTVHFSFEGIDEAKFSTPKNPQYVTYVHDAVNHTGVLTGTAFGNEGIQFSQAGTDRIFSQTRNVQVYVDKHPVTLTTTLNGGTWKVDSVYTGEVYSVNTPGAGEPAMNAISVTAKHNNVLQIVDGHWKAIGAGKDTLVISHEATAYWAGAAIEAVITVEKYTPVFDWNLPATVNYNRAFTTPVSSTNTMDGCTFSYVSGDPSVINWTNNTLRTFEKAGSHVGVTVTQEGNYKWNSKTQTFYVDVAKLPNHVEFTVNSEAVYNAVYANKQGEVAWAGSDGIRLGGSSTAILPGKPCYNFDDKYIIINFTGIPKKISFTTGLTSNVATAGINGNGFWYMEQKSETGNWSNVWTEESSNNPGSISKDLNPDTRYVKICYTGNFAGYVKNLKITERTEIRSGKDKLDFGSADAGSDATSQNVNISWYNVNPLTLSIKHGSDKYSVSPTSIESSKDNYAIGVPVTVSYKHTAGGTHVDTLVITDGDVTKEIPLTGTTNKVTPEITWKENLSPMSRGENVTDPAEALVALTYTSSDSTVVDVEGNVLKPLKKGNATITASYDGSESLIYNSNSSSINVLVTNLAVQHIHWTQTFTRLKWSDDPVLSEKNTPDFDFDATVSYYDPETEQEVAITDRSVAYTSGNTSVVQVLPGNKLHVVGQGNTTLTAHINGITDSLYEATVVRDVIVREPTLDCEKWVLENKSASMATEINSFSGVETVYALSGEPGYLSFEAWREAIHVIKDWTDGNLFVAEKIGSNWHELTGNDGLALDLNYENRKAFDSIPLSRDATQVKIYKKTGSTGIHAFSGAYVTLARYLELENTKNKKSHNIDLTASEAKPGVVVEKTFTVNYSNITDQLDVELKHGDKFSIVSDATIGNECGDKGKATVRVRFLSNDVDLYKDTLLVHNLTDTVYVYLSADVDKHQQQITWEPATTNLKTTDNVTFDATTSASAANLSVSYYVTEGTAATVNETTGELSIGTEGTVTVEARCAGNDKYYDATPVSQTFVISKVKPTITEIPTAATMTLPNTTLSGCTLSGGAASVDGSFAWDDNTVDVTLNNTGYKVNFTPDNTNWYDTASCTVVVPVEKQTQEITWDFVDTVMYCNAKLQFDATSNLGLEVSYRSSDNSIAYVDDNDSLRIIKGGDVTITAYQNGTEVVGKAADVSKNLHIHRFTPTIVALPTAATMKIGRLLDNATLKDGRAELAGVEVEGTFSWVDGDVTTMDVAGVFTKAIVFTPANINYYEPVDTVLDVTVEKYAPKLSDIALSGSMINYGQALSNSTLSGTLTATDTVKVPNVPVAGSIAWKDETTIPNAGNPSHAKAVFVPTDTDWYTEVEIKNVPLVVNSVQAASYTATAMIVYGERLSEAEMENTTTGVFSEHVNGSVAWADGVNLDEVLAIGTHEVAIRFTSESNNYTDGDGICVVTVLEGVVFKGGTNDSWAEGGNWQGGNTPSTEDRVTVAANVEISDTVEIGGLTINEGFTLTVKEGATLTIGDKDSYLRNAYGSIHVKNGGKLVCGTGKVKVKNLTLDAQLGSTIEDVTSPSASGQVQGADNLDINGEAYFQLALDPSGRNTYGWYDFVVPFEVDVIGGISIAEAPNTPMKFNVNYAVMSYDESKRAVNGKDWNKFSGTMEPGRVYTITLDETQDWNTVVFKKKKGAAVTGDRSFTTSYSGLGEDIDNGWNGFGNGSLQHMELDVPEGTLVQVYDHANKCYRPREAKDLSIAVGLSFFMQVDGVETIELKPAEGNSAFLAPKRVQESADKFRLALTMEGASNASDYLWVSASEEATGEYVIGRDVLKMGTMTSSKVARLWSCRNDINLCSNEMQLVSNKAVANLSMYAPKDGVYTLEIEKAPEDATLYLTYNNRVIWNLSMSPYDFELTKGTTEGYGLRMVAETPQVTTDLENEGLLNGADGVRKVLIDNVLYIITPEGKMYDIVGKGIKF